VCGYTPLLRIEGPQSTVPSAQEILSDPACSHWLRNALATALKRDPVDAANDADVLANVLDANCRQVVSRS
jgi:hypothetical protein